jgi:hypothetical protein
MDCGICVTGGLGGGSRCEISFLLWDSLGEGSFCGILPGHIVMVLWSAWISCGLRCWDSPSLPKVLFVIGSLVS